MNHVLKIWPQYYHAVKDGSKTFEIRKNDRGFQKGDTVTLTYHDPDLSKEELVIEKAKHKDLEFQIGYVYPLDKNECVFSLIPISKKK